MKFIIGSTDIKIGLFPGKQPYSSTSCAFVYVNPQEEMIAIKDGDRLNGSELKVGRFNKMFRIDTTPKSIDYEDEFPSMETVETFDIIVSMTVKVEDPVIILQHQHKNYREMLENYLFFAVSNITKKHPVQQQHQVSVEIEGLKRDTRFMEKMEHIGLTVTDISANVDMSKKSKEHLEKMANLKKDEEYKTTETRTKTNIKIEEMDGLNQLASMYGPDGLRIALASTDAERAAIIEELQEKQRKQQQDQDKRIQVLLDKGLSIQEVKEVLNIKTDSGQHPFQHSVDTAKTEKIVEPQRKEEEDPVLSGFSEIIDALDNEKGE